MCLPLQQPIWQRRKVHGSPNKMPPKRKRRHHLVLVVVHPVPQDLPKKNKVKAQHPDRLVVLLLTTTLELAAMATSATAARYPHRLRQVVGAPGRYGTCLTRDIHCFYQSLGGHKRLPNTGWLHHCHFLWRVNAFVGPPCWSHVATSR